MSNKKKWKDHFLSSGIPLEHSVSEVLKSRDFFAPREYVYERPNEVGLRTQFSVDVYACYVDIELNLLLEVFL